MHGLEQCNTVYAEFPEFRIDFYFTFYLNWLINNWLTVVPINRLWNLEWIPGIHFNLGFNSTIQQPVNLFTYNSISIKN